MGDNTAGMIGIKEVAKRMGVSEETVRRDVKKGRIRRHVSGKRVRFVWAEVLEDTEERKGPKWTL